MSCFIVRSATSPARPQPLFVFSTKEEDCSSASARASATITSEDYPEGLQRRALLRRSAVSLISFSSMLLVAHGTTMVSSAATTVPAVSLDKLLEDLKKAKSQMAPIPNLIQKEQWDSVRAILITPPLSDLWTRSARPTSLLSDYAVAVGDNPAGDELAVLEAKEELLSHLRYLDMAVYNNVFNPIKTEGTTGATKELIRSYFEDPIIEFKASLKSLEELIELGSL